MPSNNAPSKPEMTNLFIAIVLTLAIMIGWQYFYEMPREKAAHAVAEQQQALQAKEVAKAPEVVTEPAAPKEAPAPTVKIENANLHGSISMRGALFNDLTLARYHEAVDPQSPEVKLLSSGSESPAYGVETGWLPADASIKVPDANSIWKADHTTLTETQPVTLKWDNGAGLTFEKTIALDDGYMFTITQRVVNRGSGPQIVYPYGAIRRNYDDSGKTPPLLLGGNRKYAGQDEPKKHVYFMHEGPLGVTEEGMQDYTYKKLRNDGDQKISGAGWVGVTDKYWLTALIPAPTDKFDATFSHVGDASSETYQADLREGAQLIPVGSEAKNTLHFFAGAKEVKRLDAYRTQLNIPLFDRAVDFGSLYLLTKPIFEVLSYFHGIVGNFGVAILLLTLCIKLLLYPLAHKSMVSMAHMKLLTPKMKDLREKHKSDKMKLNQEVMALYKREKVNPMAGCLPLLLQIPVFLSLYRVLYVTIEMRHAPFYGWIHDLSAPDPTNIFTLFGLIPWVPPHMLHIGVLPMIMCLTMVVQQKLNPKPADEIQAAMMNYMPYFFLIMFANFPAGLVIYWAWNNTLSIIQQLYINTHLKKKGLK